ncbi:MAG: serine--tRNA ligase, partial [Rhodospirillaceae bacterium]
MLDLRWIRENPEALDAALASRGAAPAAARIVALDARHREAVTELQQLQSRRNEASKEIGAVKSKGGDAAALMAEVATIRDRMQALEATVAELAQSVDEAVQTLPNLPAADVPPGRDEADN